MSIEIANIKKSFWSHPGAERYLTGYSFWSDGRVAGAVRFRENHAAANYRRAGASNQRAYSLPRHRRQPPASRDRKVGFVFQHYALFRHMTVFDNIAFGLTVLPRRERPNAAAIKAKVTNLLEMVQLAHLADRYPAQLSGGQKQRVALGARWL